MKCNMCPRECNVERGTDVGFCGMPWEFYAARAAKHMWEEPCISGKNGSGTVFFSGCNLRCTFCQNFEISHDCKGKPITDKRLMEIFDELIESGAHNINLVNPTHYAIQLASVLEKYHSSVPVVYNCGGYEKVETLKRLEGLVDIYLPDLKYISSERSKKYSAADDYFTYSSKALSEMKRQQPENIFDSDGMMQKGMIVRHLILPKNTNQSIEILSWIKDNLSCETIVSLMAQYTPFGNVEKYPELQRKITAREYEKVVEAMEDMGFSKAYVQQRESSGKLYIPEFDFRGI